MSVQRTRLLRLLAEPASACAVLLVAPPGYGKTVLLQQYAEDEQLVYINLSAAATREAFVRELVAAVAPRSLRSLGTLLSQGGNPGFESILATWMLVRLRTVETTIVLDDLQGVAGDQPTMSLLSKLVEGTRSHIRWMLSSRAMPVLPIGTWLAYSITTLPITERDLSFTDEEARVLAGELRVELSDADLTAVVEHNAGWPIGIRLALEAWERFRRPEPLLRETRQYLFDLLQSELWRNLTRIQRELILACALLPRVAIDVLVEAGYTNAPRLLATIERKIPFVSKNPDGTYAIHELFRDFVLAAAQERPALMSRTLAAIGTALAKQDRFVEALDIARRSRVPEQTLSVLGLGGLTLLETGARQLVDEALAELPSSYADHGVVLALRGANAHSGGNGANAEALFAGALASGDLARDTWTEVARRLAAYYTQNANPNPAIELLRPLLSDPALSSEHRLLVGASLAAALAVAGKADEARNVVDRVLGELALANAENRARALDRLAFALFYCGDHERSKEFAIDASSLAIETGLDRIAAASYSILLAIASMEDSDSHLLNFYAREQAVAAERAGDRAILIRSLLVQYATAAEAGNREASERIRKSLDELGQSTTYRDDFSFALVRALSEAGIGDFDKATAIFVSVPEQRMIPAERLIREALVATFALANGKRDEALARVGSALLTEASADFFSLRQLALAHAWRALALWALDRPAQARRSIGSSDVRLSARDRIFVDAIAEIIVFPHPLPNLDNVRPALERLENAGMGAIANLIRRLIERDKPTVELTPAELLLLRAFYEHGGRTADVAATLRKSPYTVRNQIRSAIAKIGCSGRNEAIRYARQRGWF